MMNDCEIFCAFEFRGLTQCEQKAAWPIIVAYVKFVLCEQTATGQKIVPCLQYTPWRRLVKRDQSVVNIYMVLVVEE